MHFIMEKKGWVNDVFINLIIKIRKIESDI